MEERKKIKIMQITHDLNYGGLQKLVVDISKNLDKSRYQVSVCALREGGPLEEGLLKEDIRIIKLPPSNNGADYLSFWKLYKIFKEEKPDIVHTHNTQPFVEGGVAAILAKVPVHIHTDHGRQFPDKRRYMFAEWVFSHFANQMVAVSENLKEDISRYEGIRLDKIKVILNGINGSKYNNKIDKNKKRRELGIDNKHNIILGFVGRLSPEKGLTYLIKAMEALVKEFPNLLLLIAGEGELLKELKREAIALGIEQNIRFLGPRSDINEILGIFDIFVLPSLREGLPLVLLEAAAASLPIVATDVGGNKQVVKHGANGLLIRHGDVDSLYNAVKKLIIDEGMRKEFGSKSHDLFINNFTIEKMIKKYETIYQDCLKSTGARG